MSESFFFIYSTTVILLRRSCQHDWSVSFSFKCILFHLPKIFFNDPRDHLILSFFYPHPCRWRLWILEWRLSTNFLSLQSKLPFWSFYNESHSLYLWLTCPEYLWHAESYELEWKHAAQIMWKHIFCSNPGSLFSTPRSLSYCDILPAASFYCQNTAGSKQLYS